MTTIHLPPQVLDRLKGYGVKGQSYAELIVALLDRVDHEEFMERQYARLAERKGFTPLDEGA